MSIKFIVVVLTTQTTEAFCNHRKHIKPFKTQDMFVYETILPGNDHIILFI